MLVVGILGASLMAGIAQAQSSNLSDGFGSFDETTWAKKATTTSGAPTQIRTTSARAVATWRSSCPLTR